MEVVCNKFFKSEKQFEAHELSNKHKKTLRKLKWEMKQEGIDLGIDKDDMDLDEYATANENEDNESEEADDPELPEVDEPEAGNDTLSNAEEKDVDFMTFAVDDDLNSDFSLSDSSFTIPLPTSKKQKKKNKKAAKPVPIDDTDEIVDDELTKLAAGLTIDHSDDDWDTKKPKKVKKKKASTPMDGDVKDVESADSRSSTPILASAPKKDKKKDKKDKKEKIPNGSEVCVVCDEIFTSRNKLFQHVKVTGHAAAPTKVKKKGKK